MVNKRVSRIISRLTSVLSVLVVAAMIAAPVTATRQTDLAGPSGSGQFGSKVIVLSNGNFIVADPYYDAGATTDVGAVYLYNGATLALISTLTGSTVNDAVGGDGAIGEYGVRALSNGNFIVISPNWQNGNVLKAGAVTWCSGTSGCNGPVTPANSLVGTQVDDQVGSDGVHILSNGDYVVISSHWHNGNLKEAGAVTWCSGTSGCSGPVTPANSLVGTYAFTNVGSNYVRELTNGNFVVQSPHWHNGTVGWAGAVTWCSGTGGCSGPVTPTNSLVGSQTDDQVGIVNVLPLSNGNYVVSSTEWHNGTNAYAGAVTWCSGTSGCSGPVTSANSLVGRQPYDQVGYGNYGHNGVLALTNDNYLVASPDWANGTANQAGAVTFCSGIAGCSGPVTPANSLVGSQMNDGVGGNVTAFISGNYVVSSSSWSNGTVKGAGAVTWCSGTSGCAGLVTPTNSLVGSQAFDHVSWVTDLSNGNYVVSSSHWANGTATQAGAVTLCSDASGCIGPVTVSNSLVGSQTDDKVGYDGVTKLSNGNYVVSNRYWSNGTAKQAGAVTLCSGTIGCSGPVTPANSLLGSQAGDMVGYVTTLSIGNYVVASPQWANGTATQAGAVTWCSGTIGCSGPVTPANSLVGSQIGDMVGYDEVTALSNGNYVVDSSWWANGSATKAGAVTWCSGTSGCSGPVTPANSLLGSLTNDSVGDNVTALSNGNYVVSSPYWANGSVTRVGAVTWCNGTSGCNGLVTQTNSLMGSQMNDEVGMWGVLTLINQDYVVSSMYWASDTATKAGAVTWCSGTTGCSGPITDQNSVLGTAPNGGSKMVSDYDKTYGYLVIGRPADNKVSLLIQVSMVYLPLVVR